MRFPNIQCRGQVLATLYNTRFPQIGTGRINLYIASSLYLLCIMLTCKQRLVADHTIGVADLMKPLEQFIEICGNNSSHLMVLHGTSSTPSIRTNSAGEWKFMDYIRRSRRNTVLSGKKHKNAICRIDEANRVNFTKKSPSDFYDQVDDAIRMGLSHLRHFYTPPSELNIKR